MSDRIPPQNLDAELAVIGSALLDNETVSGVLLEPGDFYHPTHRKLWEAVLSLDTHGEPIDYLTLATKLGTHDHDETMRQATGIAIVAKRGASYAAEIRKCSAARALIERTRDAMQAAFDKDLDTAKNILADIDTLGLRKSNLITGIEWATKGLKRVEDEIESFKDGKPFGIPTGFGEIDHLTGGMYPADYWILMARPSMGKTALALCIALNVLEAGYPVFIASLEMTAEKLFKRALICRSGIPWYEMRQGRGDPADAAIGLSELPIYIDDTGGATPGYIRSIARRVRKLSKADLGLIIVDHLHIVAPDRKQVNRNSDITDISAAIRKLGKDIGWPVLALAQLNRGVEARTDKRPQLSDLRESGSLEQDADVVAGLYRDHHYNPSVDHRHAEFLVRKNRDGELKEIPLAWSGSTQTFGGWA